MELDENLKSKVRYHLGFNAGAQIPAGDRSRVEEAMSLVPDELWYNEIVYHVKRCDIAWKASAAIGDVQRTINTSDPLKGDEDYREIYLREVDRLAETLYVPNYRRPEVRRYAFERAGAEFILAVPGPADTAVGSRIFLNTNWR